MAVIERVSEACGDCRYNGYVKESRGCFVPGGFCWKRFIEGADGTVGDLLVALGIMKGSIDGT